MSKKDLKCLDQSLVIDSRSRSRAGSTSTTMVDTICIDPQIILDTLKSALETDSDFKREFSMLINRDLIGQITALKADIKSKNTDITLLS